MHPATYFQHNGALVDTVHGAPSQWSTRQFSEVVGCFPPFVRSLAEDVHPLEWVTAQLRLALECSSWEQVGGGGARNSSFVARLKAGLSCSDDGSGARASVRRIFPMCDDIHYRLMVVDPRVKCIYLLDSLGGCNGWSGSNHDAAALLRTLDELQTTFNAFRVVVRPVPTPRANCSLRVVSLHSARSPPGALRGFLSR
jgi:hypothetical protein